ncbi:MAG: hypothetical protein V1909_02195 [Candidatus Micrarchaeota archaeon]
MQTKNQPKRPQRPVFVINHLAARYAMLGQQTRESFIARNVPTKEQTSGRLGASGIAMPWSNARRRTSKF